MPSQFFFDPSPPFYGELPSHHRSGDEAHKPVDSIKLSSFFQRQGAGLGEQLRTLLVDRVLLQPQLARFMQALLSLADVVWLGVQRETPKGNHALFWLVPLF